MSAKLIDGAALARLIPLMRKYKKKTLIEAVQVPFDFVLRQENDAAAQATGQSVISGSVECPAGTWLARSPAGTYYPIPCEQFELMYEPTKS